MPKDFVFDVAPDDVTGQPIMCATCKCGETMISAVHPINASRVEYGLTCTMCSERNYAAANLDESGAWRVERKG